MSAKSGIGVMQSALDKTPDCRLRGNGIAK
jgi:hypothetical protein